MVKKVMMAATLLSFPMVMTSPVEAKEREYCREYTKTIYVDGHRERAYGTACYRGEGTWEIVSLHGDHHARHEVKEVIYKDIHKKKHKRGGKTIIISNSKHPHAYYHRSHYKVTHDSSPFFKWTHYGRDDYNCKSKHHRHR